MSMEDRDGVIWIDGALVPWREARVHVLSYTFLHGAGVFEGVRAYAGDGGGAVFRLRDHSRRLFGSARILGIAIPYSIEEIDAAHLEVARANGLEACYFRPVVYYDGSAVGVSAHANGVHVMIAAWSWDSYHGAAVANAGLRLKTSSFSRHHVNSTMIKAKANGHYVNSMMAVAEAKQCGFDDALMLDTQGFVSECSTSNVFVVRGGNIATPDRASILEGITRDTVMTLARDRGLTVEERRITRDELYCADEVFVTGTAAEIVPVVEFDGRRIGDGAPGATTRMLQDAYGRAVRGQDPARRDWLTPIGAAAASEPVAARPLAAAI